MTDEGVVGRTEPVTATLRRLTVELFDRALFSMADRHQDFDESIHRTRTALKKVRAVLRLGREEIGTQVLRKENAAIRDLGASLADLRDGAVRVDTLRRIRSDFSTVLAPEAFDGLAAALAEHYRLDQRRFQLDARRLDGVVHSLRSARAHYLAWGSPIDRTDGGFAALAPGLGATYRAGKRAMTIAFRSRTPEAFHEWRKQVKYYRYQLEILEPMWPAQLGPTAESAHQLSDLLGVDHDLWVLAAAVAGDLAPATTLAERTVLDALIERSRFELEKLAMPLGQMLYAESTASVVKRFGIYWEAWRS